MKRIISATLALSALLSLGACDCKETAQTEPIASHVFLIGLDGWGSWCMETGECPFIREMMQEGSYTLNKRTVLPSSSGPNWAAMMNGTPVEATGIISNNATPDFKPLVLTEHNAQPTFFHQLKQVCPEAETGVICEWGDFLNYTDPACVDYQKKIHDPETFTEAVVEESVQYIQEKKPVLCFIHIDALDHKGHANGQGSPEYYAELPLVDSRVQRIVEGIKAAGIYEAYLRPWSFGYRPWGYQYAGNGNAVRDLGKGREKEPRNPGDRAGIRHRRHGGQDLEPPGSPELAGYSYGRVRIGVEVSC